MLYQILPLPLRDCSCSLRCAGEGELNSTYFPTISMDIKKAPLGALFIIKIAHRREQCYSL